MEKHVSLLIKISLLIMVKNLNQSLFTMLPRSKLFTSNLFEEQKQRTSEGSENSTLH